MGEKRAREGTSDDKICGCQDVRNNKHDGVNLEVKGAPRAHAPGVTKKNPPRPLFSVGFLSKPVWHGTAGTDDGRRGEEMVADPWKKKLRILNV